MNKLSTTKPCSYSGRLKMIQIGAFWSSKCKCLARLIMFTLHRKDNGCGQIWFSGERPSKRSADAGERVKQSAAVRAPFQMCSKSCGYCVESDGRRAPGGVIGPASPDKCGFTLRGPQTTDDYGLLSGKISQRSAAKSSCCFRRTNKLGHFG